VHGPYRPSPHARICVSGGQVLLDLTGGGCPGVLSPSRLARWVQGWPVPAGPPQSADASADAVPARLLASSLLLSAGVPGKYAAPLDIMRAPVALAARGAFPEGVFGVKVDSFAAHGGLQQGGLVCKALPDTVRAPSPIKAV
jgi:hypothetical protein